MTMRYAMRAAVVSGAKFGIWGLCLGLVLMSGRAVTTDQPLIDNLTIVILVATVAAALGAITELMRVTGAIKTKANPPRGRGG
jgi:hypothetical protein